MVVTSEALFRRSKLFPVQFGQQLNQVQRISHVHHSHSELIMGDRVECLLEVHKAHTECLLELACLVHQYSEIRDLVSLSPFPCLRIQLVRLLFLI